MMFKRTMITFIVLILICLGTGCRKQYEYTYLYDKERITAIELVRFNSECEDYRNLEIVLTIECIDDFLADFSKLSFYKTSLGPVGISENDVVIKFIYDNGDFELIHYHGQAQYVSELGSANNAGDGTFIEKDFKDLLEKYS